MPSLDKQLREIITKLIVPPNTFMSGELIFRLADILLAINKTEEIKEDYIFFGVDGTLWYWENGKLNKSDIIYNLSQDNLELQSEEFRKSLLEILS